MGKLQLNTLNPMFSGNIMRHLFGFDIGNFSVLLRFLQGFDNCLLAILYFDLTRNIIDILDCVGVFI